MLQVFAAGDQYGVDPETLPLRLVVGFGDAADSSAGLCADYAFGDSSCVSDYWAVNSGRIVCETE